MSLIKPVALVLSLACLLIAVKNHRNDGPIATTGTLLLIVGAIA